MVIEHNEPTLFVGGRLTSSVLAALIKSNGLILWDKEGLWGLLTRAHLQDLLDQWEMAQAHKAMYPRATYNGAGLLFSNTIPVSSEVARALRLNG